MVGPLNLELTLVGTNHTHAPMDVRERLACRPDTLRSRLKSLVNDNVREAVVLSTCNRTEIYTLSARDADVAGDVKRKLAEWSEIGEAELERYLYVQTSQEVVGHLIRVASGLDSLAVGEQQVQDQVTQALRLANRVGTSGRFLSDLFRFAGTAAENVRRQSGLEDEQFSVSSVVSVMLRQLSTERKIRTILLVGAGKMISLAAEDLAALPGVEVWVANRTLQKAKDLAHRVGGQAIGLSDVLQTLENADVLVTCTSAEDYVIKTEELRRAMEKRPGKELIVIDVALPRNIDPKAKLIPGVKVYDIDALVPFAEARRTALKSKFDEAERLASEETQNFYAHARAYDANDLLKDLRKVAEDIREKELSRALRKLGELPTREKAILDLLTRRIVNKLLYEPTIRLKEHATNGDRESYEHLIRELFDLGRQSEQ